MPHMVQRSLRDSPVWKEAIQNCLIQLLSQKVPSCICLVLVCQPLFMLKKKAFQLGYLYRILDKSMTKVQQLVFNRALKSGTLRCAPYLSISKRVIITPKGTKVEHTIKAIFQSQELTTNWKNAGWCGCGWFSQFYGTFQEGHRQHMMFKDTYLLQSMGSKLLCTWAAGPVWVKETKEGSLKVEIYIYIYIYQWVYENLCRADTKIPGVHPGQFCVGIIFTTYVMVCHGRFCAK